MHGDAVSGQTALFCLNHPDGRLFCVAAIQSRNSISCLSMLPNVYLGSKPPEQPTPKASVARGDFDAFAVMAAFLTTS